MATLGHVGASVSLADSTGRLRRMVWLLVLVVGIVAYEVVLRVMIDTKNVNFFPSLLLIGAITVPVSVLVFAETGGRTISVTPWLVATTAVVGGVVGTITAGTLEYDTLRGLGTASPKAPTSPDTAAATSPPSPPRSTAGHERRSAGRPRPKRSTRS